jgi:ATP-dependent DNA helicase HFM1/MER3
VSDADNSSPSARISSRRQVTSHSSGTKSLQYAPSRSSAHSIQSQHLNLSHAPPIANGIRLVSPHESLPDNLRVLFPYELFNAVQSKCFSSAYASDDNLVVAAPTGSGKTVVLELAICRLVSHHQGENCKIVYQAPTKALCAERARDWRKKFSHMAMEVLELTGDTSQTDMRRIGNASIIITTPEKWDSITRRWQDHRKLVELVRLFLIDEVHMLKDTRGATLEAVVSRMKTVSLNVRFVALSATIPNSEDIARWLGKTNTNSQAPAQMETFGDELRPVKLQKHVYGFDTNGSDWNFDRFLDQKLPNLLMKHTQRKPIMIFCFTKKSCENTARALGECWAAMPADDKLWRPPSKRIPVISSALQESVRWGVAFHHGGLDPQDRSVVEQNFLSGEISVICCTSTLAVGVNLPCHTVILKGTMGFENGQLREYSDLEIMQMLGRAGRPQFEDSAVAIILTKKANKTRYDDMVSGNQVIESTFHLNLIEHLNSEIVLRTINSVDSGKRWLAGTFLSVRIGRNPMHYRLTTASGHGYKVDDKLAEICERNIKLLQEHQLIAVGGENFSSTVYGRAMSNLMIQFDSMKELLKIPKAVKMERLVSRMMKQQGTQRLTPIACCSVSNV